MFGLFLKIYAMQKIANFIKSFTDFVDKYSIAFHSASLVFWCCILYLNINNPSKDDTFLKISFYITISLIVLSTINLIAAIRNKIIKK